MKIVVAHPSKQHSFFTATALKKSGDLDKYITTVYDKNGAITSTVKKFLGKQDKKKASTHRCEDLEDSDVIQYFEIDYLISLFLNRFPQIAGLREKHRQYVADKFGKKVAAYAIKNNVDAVIMYDSTATTCFELLKKKAPQIKCVLDVSIASRPFLKKEFEKDMAQTCDYSLKRDYPNFWNDAAMKTFYREIELADFFFAPSNIVRESLEFCGAKAEQIFIIPYGVKLEAFPKREKAPAGDTLKLIYVGQVTHRKGIHHLLNVIDQFNSDSVSLKLVGTYSESENFVQKAKNKKNIEFCGFKTHDELLGLYQESDAFIFPTLGEGYGLVVLEAMSAGIPVLSSDHAGGNDPIIDYHNGIVFRAGDESDLYEKIQWCIENKEQLKAMGENANVTVQDFTWDTYYERICKATEQIVNG